jgi:hypothetical protein
MLADNPCSHPIIMIREAKAEEIEGILKFIYTGEVKTPLTISVNCYNCFNLDHGQTSADMTNPGPSFQLYIWPFAC